MQRRNQLSFSYLNLLQSGQVQAMNERIQGRELLLRRIAVARVTADGGPFSHGVVRQEPPGSWSIPYDDDAAAATISVKLLAVRHRRFQRSERKKLRRNFRIQVIACDRLSKYEFQ